MVVIVEGSVKHKLAFDMMSSEKSEMERLADAFWGKTASVRAKFYRGTSRPQLPVAQSSINALQRESKASNSNERHGFHVSKMGVVSGPHSDQEIKTMIDKGELNDSDLVRVEIWLPFATLRLLNMAAPIQIQSSVNCLQPTTALSNPTLPRKTDNSDLKKKHQGSISPTIAAGVGGVIAGAVATSLLTPEVRTLLQIQNHLIRMSLVFRALLRTPMEMAQSIRLELIRIMMVGLIPLVLTLTKAETSMR